MRSRAPAPPRACPLPTVTLAGFRWHWEGQPPPKFQAKELNRETAMLHRATSAWPRPAAATGQSPLSSQDHSLMCTHHQWACPQAQVCHTGASAATLGWAGPG